MTTWLNVFLSSCSELYSGWETLARTESSLSIILLYIRAWPYYRLPDIFLFFPRFTEWFQKQGKFSLICCPAWALNFNHIEDHWNDPDPFQELDEPMFGQIHAVLKAKGHTILYTRLVRYLIYWQVCSHCDTTYKHCNRNFTNFSDFLPATKNLSAHGLLTLNST